MRNITKLLGSVTAAGLVLLLALGEMEGHKASRQAEASPVQQIATTSQPTTNPSREEQLALSMYWETAGTVGGEEKILPDSAIPWAYGYMMTRRHATGEDAVPFEPELRARHAKDSILNKNAYKECLSAAEEILSTDYSRPRMWECLSGTTSIFPHKAGECEKTQNAARLRGEIVIGRESAYSGTGIDQPGYLFCAPVITISRDSRYAKKE